MGIFTAITAFAVKAAKAVVTVAKTVWPVIQTYAPKVAKTVAHFAEKVATFIEEHRPAISLVSRAVSTVVSKVAEKLGLKKENVDPPEEMAMKAESEETENGVTREEFDSAEAYIQHLHDDVELTEEQHQRLENMEPEERLAYTITGSGIYLSGITEKTNISENAFTPDIMMDFHTIGLNAERVLQILEALRDAQIENGDVFSNYLHGGAVSAENREKIMTAMKAVARKMNPEYTEEELDRAARMLIKDMREKL